MKRRYEAPELEIQKLNLSLDVLGPSKDEIPASSGFVTDPDDELLEDDGL